MFLIFCTIISILFIHNYKLGGGQNGTENQWIGKLDQVL